MATVKLNFFDSSVQKSNKEKRQAACPWVEKYTKASREKSARFGLDAVPPPLGSSPRNLTLHSRPKTVDDVVHQDEVVSTLKKSIETGNLPHLLFYGGPGTGKTSTILAIAHQLYGPEEIKSRILELNASDERGIDVVRNKVKTFSSLAVSNANKSGDYPCPPYKIVILDEADHMTTDAQNALRRTMEEYSGVTRFCFICNYVSRIIEPLASRCAKFRFRALGEERMAERLDLIAKTEGVAVTEEIIKELTVVSGGDMRRAITYLQSLHRLSAASITLDTVYMVAGVIPKKEIEELLTTCKSPSFPRLQMAVNKMINNGYSVAQFLTQFQQAVIEDGSITNVQKATITEAIAAADKCLTDGADEFLQLLNVCSLTMKAICT